MRNLVIPDLQALGSMKLLLPRTDMAPNGAELLQLGELSTEARVWDHQRFRFFGRGETLGDVGSLGVMDVCEDDFGREFVMPFIERTWTYFFFIFFW